MRILFVHQNYPGQYRYLGYSYDEFTYTNTFFPPRRTGR